MSILFNWLNFCNTTSKWMGMCQDSFVPLILVNWSHIYLLAVESKKGINSCQLCLKLFRTQSTDVYNLSVELQKAVSSIYFCTDLVAFWHSTDDILLCWQHLSCMLNQLHFVLQKIRAILIFCLLGFLWKGCKCHVKHRWPICREVKHTASKMQHFTCELYYNQEPTPFIAKNCSRQKFLVLAHVQRAEWPFCSQTTNVM